jgi:hypothetical protein
MDGACEEQVTFESSRRRNHDQPPNRGKRSGESYETKAGAKRGIDAVQRAANGAKVEDLTTDS